MLHKDIMQYWIMMYQYASRCLKQQIHFHYNCFLLDKSSRSSILKKILLWLLHLHTCTLSCMCTVSLGCFYLSYSIVFFYSLRLLHKDCAVIFALPAHSYVPPPAVSGSMLSPQQTSLAIHDHLVASLHRAHWCCVVSHWFLSTVLGHTEPLLCWPSKTNEQALAVIS